MIVKCPNCNSQFDLELNDVVVEMLFSCPNCKARFYVRNQDGVHATVLEDKPNEVPRPHQPAAQLESKPVDETEPASKPAKAARTSGKPKERSSQKGGSPAFWLAVMLFLLVSVVGMAMWCLQDEQTVAEQSEDDHHRVLVLVVDVSTSMLAEDLQPNRIEAVKQAASSLVAAHPDDSIGVVLFAGEALVECAPTNRHDSLLRQLDGVDVEMAAQGIIKDGTAIGMGLGAAIGQLAKTTAQDKVAVLFTDGTNNCGSLSPTTAAELAQTYSVRVFTVAVGKNGTVPYPVTVGGKKQYVNLPSEVDTLTLASMAETTRGKHYRSDSNARLQQVCQEIARLQEESPQAAAEQQDKPLYDEASARRLLNLAIDEERQTQRRIQQHQKTVKP